METYIFIDPALDVMRFHHIMKALAELSALGDLKARYTNAIIIETDGGGDVVKSLANWLNIDLKPVAKCEPIGIHPKPPEAKIEPAYDTMSDDEFTRRLPTLVGGKVIFPDGRVEDYQLPGRPVGGWQPVENGPIEPPIDVWNNTAKLATCSVCKREFNSLGGTGEFCSLTCWEKAGSPVPARFSGVTIERSPK